jgi:HSP20 family protein
MAIRDLIPWGRQDDESRLPISSQGSGSPLLTLHREVNRLFDDVFRGFNLPSLESVGRFTWPQIEVSEADNELRVTAELPGMTEKDVDVSVDDGVLTLRGERKSEKADKESGYSERFYGRFERRIALPSDVDDEKATAKFKDGVLTIALPRSPEAVRGRCIPINAETKH